MDGVIELWEKGQVVLITLMGMGGVFFALLCLYGFTSGLGKLFSRPKSVTTGKSTDNPPKQKATDENEALAAAIAVTWALSSSRKVAVQARSQDGANPWKMAGRAAMMQPLNRRDKAPGRKRRLSA